MNERKQFEARYPLASWNREYSGYELLEHSYAFAGWIACAESKQAELNALIAELAKHQSSEFHPDWSMLQASQESLREHMQMVKYKQADLDKANARIDELTKKADQQNKE